MNIDNTAPCVLMCAPEHFEVFYEINSFMEGNCGRVDFHSAQWQWAALYEAIVTSGAQIELVKPHPKLPDLVFTANAGLVWGDHALLSRFATPERSGEEPVFRDWFQTAGYDVVEVSGRDFFEGEGDVVVRDHVLFMGCHSRTSEAARQSLEQLTGREVIPLRLNPKGLYHLDTCMFCASETSPLFFCPDAFMPEDRETIRSRVGPSNCIEVGWEEANHFACNTVVIGDTAISPLVPPSFVEKIESAGLRSVTVDLSEFIKAGGAAKCLVLHLHDGN